MKSETVYRILIPLLLFLAFSVTACDTATDPSESSTLYTAGTYTERADGYGGAIKVSTVFSGDRIMEITVDSHKESSDKRAEVAAALEQIPQAIIDGQTLVVDKVTGATRTGNGILKAVEKCVLKAGGESAVEKLK